MPRPIIPLAVAAALLASCAATAPFFKPMKGEGRSEQAVHLRFAWPEDFSAQVIYTYKVEHPVGRQQLDVGRRYRLEARARGKKFRMLVPSDVKDFPPLEQDVLDPLPTVVFDREGAFVGIESGVQEESEERLLQLLPFSPDTYAHRQVVLIWAQQELAYSSWNHQVARWRGVTLVPGVPVRRTAKMDLGSFFEQVSVDAEELTTVEVDVPCDARATANRCVRLVVDTTPYKVYQAPAGAPAQDGDDRRPRMKSATGHVHFELVVEPDTLVPHSARMKREDAVDREDEKGRPSTDEYVQEEQYVFGYGEEPDPPGTISL